MRAPGVYFEPSEQRIPPLELGQTGVPVFLGITRRGPLDRPVRLTSEVRFTEIFGEALDNSYLTDALRGFFDNGGKLCYVLRIARVVGGPDEDVARIAQRHVVDRGGQRTLRVEAQDPGSWGNHLRISVTPSPEIRTFLTRDAEAGDRKVQVKSTHGLGPGTLVRFHDQSKSQWNVIARLEGKVVSLRDPLGAAYKSAAPAYVTATAFDLVVREYERSERFENLSLFGQHSRFAERVINDQSRLIRVVSLRPETPIEKCAPMDLEGVALAGGSDGLTDLGPADFVGEDRGPGARRGLLSLIEYPDIDLLAMPDLMAAFQQSKRFRSLRDVEVVQDAAISLCERSENRFAILDMPPGADFEEAQRWRQQYDSAYGALYYPWVVTLRGGERRVVPPSGHLAGIYARSDDQHGVHKAPANEVIEGIVDLDILLQDTHLAMLNDAGVNCLRPFAARGLRVWGGRTVSSDPEWRFLNVRRTVSSISYAIERGTQWVVFEPNGPTLWKRVSRLISGFLMGLREVGMLSGENPEQAFFVQCDGETNAPEDVDRGMLVTRIGLAVTRPVEFIVFRLSQRLEDQAQADEE